MFLFFEVGRSQDGSRNWEKGELQPMAQSYETSTEMNQVLTREEISSLTQEGGKPIDTLMNVVALIATRFRTDVCSAYLLEPDRSNLVLAATLGLHPKCIGTLRMPLSEGLAGLVAEQVLPVAVDRCEQPSAVQVLQGIG